MKFIDFRHSPDRPSPNLPPVGHLILWAAFILFLIMLALGPNKAMGAGEELDAGTFSIDCPQGSDWEIFREPDRIFLKRHRFAGQERIGTTALLVMRTRPVPEKCGLSAEQTAQNYCDDEEFELWLNGQITGLFGISDVARDEIEMEGKSLYAMRYLQEFAQEYGGASTENHLYIYFPPGFESDSYFFVFLQTEACLRHHCPEAHDVMDETPVRTAVRSLRIASAAGRP